MNEEETQLMTEALAEAGVSPEDAANAIKATERANAEIAQLKAQLAQEKALRFAAKLRDSCIDTFVGVSSNSNADPGSTLDLIVATSPSQLQANIAARFGTSDSFPFGGAIAFVPVVLWPTYQPDAKRPTQPLQDSKGRPIPNLQLGRTFINQSLAVHTILLPDGSKRDVSITGMATLGVAMNLSTGDIASPDAIYTRIEKALDRRSFQSTGTNPHALGDTADTGVGCFIPSTANAPDPSQQAALAHQQEQARIAARAKLART